MTTAPQTLAALVLVPWLMVVAACADSEARPDSATPASTPTSFESEPTSNPFEGRFFDESVGIGQSEIHFWDVPHADVEELAADSDVIFVGTLVGSKAELAEVRLVKEPGLEDTSALIYDGLIFEVERAISGITIGELITIAHPVFIRYPEGPARISVTPIELLRPELEAKTASRRWLVFGKIDDEIGMLTISDERLVEIDPTGLVAEGALGPLEHRLPGTVFETSIDDIDDLINRGIALPRPTPPELTREELLLLGVPLPGVPREEILHDPDSPCFGLEDDEKLLEFLKDGAC